MCNGFGGGCSWIIIIILILLCCGNGFGGWGCGCNINECGCGCNNNGCCFRQSITEGGQCCCPPSSLLYLDVLSPALPALPESRWRAVPGRTCS